jgi:hypothetical protein
MNEIQERIRGILHRDISEESMVEDLAALLSEAQPREREGLAARLWELDWATPWKKAKTLEGFEPEVQRTYARADTALAFCAAPASPPVSGEREAVGCDGEFRFAKRLDDGDLYRCVKCGAERLLPHG